MTAKEQDPGAGGSVVRHFGEGSYGMVRAGVEPATYAFSGKYPDPARAAAGFRTGCAVETCGIMLKIAGLVKRDIQGHWCG
jgi:hypothetical protein